MKAVLSDRSTPPILFKKDKPLDHKKSLQNLREKYQPKLPCMMIKEERPDPDKIALIKKKAQQINDQKQKK